MSPYNESIPLNKKITSNTYQKYPKQDFKLNILITLCLLILKVSCIQHSKYRRLFSS